MSNSSPKTKNVIRVIADIVVLVGCLFCILACVPIKKSINKEVEGICWNVKASDEVGTVKAKVSGDYCDYIIEWWNSDRFEGDIVITGQWDYNIPQVTAQFIDTKMQDGSKYTYASINSYMADTNSMNNRGQIFINKKEKLSKFVICPSDSGDMRYAFPASNRDEAEKLDKELNILRWGKE